MAENTWQSTPATEPAAGAGRRRTGRQKWLLRALAGLVAAGLVWLGWHGYLTLRAGLALRQDYKALQALAADPGTQALPALQSRMADLDTHLVALRSGAQPFLWLAPHLGWLPHFGADVAAAPALLEMAVALSHGGRQAVDALAPSAPGDQGNLFAQALPAMIAAAPRLPAIEAQLAGAERWRSQVQGPLTPGVTRVLHRFDQLLPLARAGLQFARVAPDLLGANGPRTYLILAENNHELRATGGFISGAGIVRLERGKITDLRVADSYAVDNFQQPHPQAPQVMTEQMGVQLLVLRDSNWSPDFPTSAQIARALYEQDQGVTTDGALAFDLEAVRLLVGAMGPLTVPGMPEAVTSANIIDQMKRAWARPADAQAPSAATGGGDWLAKRKDFMGPLMTAVLARVQAGQGVRPLALAEAAYRMLDERHLQIAVDAPDAAKLFAQHAWNGALEPPQNGDYLAVVDSNLGYNKTNAAVQQGIDYRVANDEQGAVANLTLTYTHTAATLSGGCARALRLEDGTYDDMIARCYWDYLRVYVPANSTLLDAQGLTGASQEVGEQGTTVLAGSFVLRPAASHIVTLRYRLPSMPDAAPYRLVVRKQAGTDATPLAVQAGPCAWRGDLAQDRMIECATWAR